MAKKPIKAATAKGAASRWRTVAEWLGRGWRSARAAMTLVAGHAKRWLVDRLRRRPTIEVLLVDRHRRRRIGREVRAALRQLRRAATPPPITGIVVCERVVASGRDLAGATHVCRRTDGGQTALIRLALYAHGRQLRDDEVLAVLAEQWLGLAQQDGANVLVPVELPADRHVPDASTAAAANDGRSGDRGRPHDPLEPVGLTGPAATGRGRGSFPFPLQPPPNGNPFGRPDADGHAA